MFNLLHKIVMNKKSTGAVQPAKDSRKKTQIAACVLLLEAAHIDNECTDDEMGHVMATLKENFALSEECAHELVALAHQKRDNSVDLWEFTNHINQHYTPDEKIEVIESVWRIIHIDGQLEKHEDYFARKLANLLRLSHKQMIDAKMKARGQLLQKSQ